MNLKTKANYLNLYEKYGEIKIKCSGKDSLPLDVMVDFQGGLKKRSEKNKIKLATQIFSKGFIAPFFIWQFEGDNFCLDGHGRLDVLAGIREAGVPIPRLFPVAYIEADNVKDAREKLLAITSQYGEFDIDELDEWLEDIDKDILDTLRLVDTAMDISLEPEDETEGDDDIDELVPPITKLGDVWELGEHRLLCGDSTDSEQVSKLMNGKKADMVFTDPPYNIDYEGGSKKREKIKNDKVDDFYNFLLQAYSLFALSMKLGASIYVCHADTERVNSTKAFVDAGFYLSSVIIWAKNNATFGRADYFWRHEPILYGWRRGAGHKWCGDNKQDTIWNIDRPSKSEEHPTMKPIELCSKAIINSSKSGDIILDLFLGSGSTLISCEKTNRVCYGMELDPHYCDIVVNRYITWCEKNERECIVKLNGALWTA